MDIPLNVQVQCADGLCGRSTYVIVNPVTQRVTHIVVEGQRFPHTEHLIPLELVIEKTNPYRTTANTPLFQVMFSYENISSTEISLCGTEVEHLKIDEGFSQVDLS